MIDVFKTSKAKIRRVGEQYLKTDVGYLASGSFWLFLSQAVTAVAGLGLAVAFAHLLPKEVFGVYRFVLSGASLFAVSTLSGLNTSLVRAVAQKHLAVYATVFRERVVWGCLGGMTALGASLYYFLQDNATLGCAFLIVAIFVPFSDPLNVYEAYRHGSKQFKYLALSEIAVRATGSATMVVSLLFFKNVILLVFIYFLTYSLLRLVFFLHTLTEARQHENQVGEHAEESLRYGKHLSVMYSAGAFAMQVDKIAIFHFAGASSLAAYAFAIIIPDQIRSSLKHFANLAFPKFTVRPLPEILSGLAGKQFRLAGLIVLIILLYILVAPFLFSLLFPTYTEAIFLTQILSLTLIDGLTLLPLSALKAHGRLSELYRYHIGIGLTQVALIWLGGWYAGLHGVIAGLISSRVLGVCILFYMIRYLELPKKLD
jgi:O-antigen/teichoic acid export membrane protein